MAMARMENVMVEDNICNIHLMTFHMHYFSLPFLEKQKESKNRDYSTKSRKAFLPIYIISVVGHNNKAELIYLYARPFLRKNHGV